MASTGVDPRAIVLLLASTAIATGTATASATIQQREGAYEMTVPASGLVVSIPRGALAPGKIPPEKADDPDYFMLEDEAQNLIVSGWIVPAQGFSGIREFWESETAQWRAMGLPAPQAVSFARYSDWEAVIYDITFPSGSNTHIRAHWVQAGTWIDLHLSTTTYATPVENRAKLKSLLKSISVREKR